MKTLECVGETNFIGAVRAGDEMAFMSLVDCYTDSMKRVALLFVQSPAAADEVVQETWIAVLRGLDRFEGRSSFKTWLFSILTNRAKTYAQRERRYVPIDLSADELEPSIAAEQFRTEGQWKDHWTTFPARWDDIPEHNLLSGEVHKLITCTINNLTSGQRDVIVLRDIEGWSSEEVCRTLNISETNQRVLLHRARSRVRQALKQYLAE